VAEEVLRRSKELQQWNPSGGYCVTIPYHYSEQRELKPDELLKIAAGIDVARCRAPAGMETEGPARRARVEQDMRSRLNRSRRGR
jgi:hypothetical protein